MTELSRTGAGAPALTLPAAPESRGFARGPALALKAAVLVCALASHSCLVPQSVDPIKESPHPAPHFVLESIPSYLLPPILQLYRQGANDQSQTPPCHCRLDLTIPRVEEDDPTITLEVRWFVDYNPADPRLAAVVWSETNAPADLNDTSPIRNLQKPYPFDPDALGITVSGVHVVDVLVAETAAYDPNSTTLPNRAVRPGYTAAEHRFVVNVKVEQDPQRPRCDQGTSATRVCQ